MRVYTDDNKAIVKCSFHEKEIVKAIGNYKFNKIEKTWEFPLHSIISIIDNLKIESDDQVISIYNRLKKEEAKREQNIVMANEVKAGNFAVPYKSWDVCFTHQKQALCVATLFDSYALFMDTGCVDGDTLIYDPINRKEITIKQLALSKKSFHVLSWDGEKLKSATTAHAFKKGKANLYEVITNNGKKIICTKNHRFFTKHGWKKLNEINVGDSVLTSDHFRINNMQYSEIKSIELIKKDADFYDMHVPFYENYYAQGFINHNTGKSLTAIKMIEYRKVPAMIVAPLSILESVWVAEIAKWSKLRAINLWKNLKGLNKPADVYIINFEHFKKLKDVHKKIKFLIVDESSRIKSYKSGITKELIQYTDKIPYRLILSGKPAPNSLLEYWGQMNLINPLLLEDNYFKFRNKYFYSHGYGGFQYLPFPGATSKIMEKVAQQAFFIQKEDCLQLPERVFEVRKIEMDPVQKKAYDEMKQLNIMEFENHTTLGVSELAKIMKLRQLSAGFSITTEGMAVHISNSKVNELMDVLDELAEGRQALIWIQFHYEIEMIKKAFDKAKKSYATLYGLMKQKEKEESIKAFKDKKVDFLIAHPKSGGIGLNLQQCSYCIWFSMSYSEEEFYQANDRIYRKGQVNKCTYILLHAKGTIDEIIYKALLRKEKMTEVCLSLLKGRVI